MAAADEVVAPDRLRRHLDGPPANAGRAQRGGLCQTPALWPAVGWWTRRRVAPCVASAAWPCTTTAPAGRSGVNSIAACPPARSAASVTF